MDDATPILDVHVSPATYANVLELLQEWVASPSHVAHTVIAANVHVVTEATLNSSFLSAVHDADIVLPDGMPLVWAMHCAGIHLPDRCYGPTLMEKALDHFQSSGARHFLYGATDAVLDNLVTHIRERWPDAVIAGVLAPPFGPLDNKNERTNIDTINQTAPDIVWVAMGCPKQELWMQRYRAHVDAQAILAVGAAFDFIAGTVRQAPRWMQRCGLEWAFRLSVEPRRLWKRYLLRNPYFAWQFLLQVLHLRRPKANRRQQSRR